MRSLRRVSTDDRVSVENRTHAVYTCSADKLLDPRIISGYDGKLHDALYQLTL
jgi:hypothetical protein